MFICNTAVVCSFQVTRMEYRPVWPASGRDFCTFHHITELAEGVFCMACEAVGVSLSNILAPLSKDHR